MATVPVLPLLENNCLKTLFNYFDTIESILSITRDSFPALGHPEAILKSGKSENYFCSGVIVFNCQKISEKDVSDCLENIRKYTRFPDQDILNHVYEGCVHYLSHQAHFLLLEGRDMPWDTLKEEDRKERQSVKNPILVHYAGKLKPWSESLKNNYQGYVYYHEYQKVKAITDQKLEKILLEVACLEFS